MARQHDEDLFKDTTMTFGEHLEELRTCLVKAIIGLVIGFLIGLWYGDRVVALIQHPLQEALEQYYQEKQSKAAIDAIEARHVARGDQPDAAPSESDGWTEEDVQHLVYEDRLTYEEYYFQPREVFTALRDAYPRTFDDVRLPRNKPGHPMSLTGPIDVEPADLLEPAKLAQVLEAAGATSQPSPARRVWELLDDNNRALVEKIAAAAAVSDEERKQFADALDTVLAAPEMYRAEDFASVELSPHARDLLARQAALTTSERLRFHRLVLEESFPDQIAPSYPDLLGLRLWRSVDDDPRLRTSSFNPQEPFIIYIKAALVTGIVLSSPWVFYQIWSFVAAGLYPHEKHYIHVFLPFSLGLFLAGAVLAFVFVFPPVLGFLFGFNSKLGIDPDPRISEWMSFVLMLPLGFGISFQLPLVMLFLERIGIFNVESYLQKWRISVLVICILSAILTPADPYSMLLMAVPLTVLYFGGVLLCHWMPRKIGES